MFNKDFRFGIGVASYQVEGAYNLDGKVPSIWDVFTHTKGRIVDSSNGDVCLDFYHRYKEDIDIAKDLGIQDFRLSLSWCRIINENQSINIKGIAFYRNVLSYIKECGMRPVVTLFHWDMPEYLDEKGGWENRDIIKYYGTYVQAVADNLSDLIDTYLTFNEPQCFIGMGLRGVEHAPLRKASIEGLLAASHHVLISHALAYQILKKKNPNCEVGFVNTCTPMIPEDKKDKDLYKACSDELFRIDDLEEDFTSFPLFTDPLYLGDYPSNVKKRYASLLKEIIKPGDMELLQKAKQKQVYLNIYTGHQCRLVNGHLASLYDSKIEDQTSFEWLKVQPEALYYGPKYVYERYHLPIVISENGEPFDDKLVAGRVEDSYRSKFINLYLAQLDKAYQEGTPITGYYYWSLLDNFEWAYGYTKRFGLIYIDYRNNLKRIKKNSFYTYQKIIKDTTKK
jgi:beta-glucosidase